MAFGLPESEGLYSPKLEKDSCGVGFVANIDGTKSHDIIEKGIQILINLTHRGAAGSDPDTGDGAGILLQLPTEFFGKVCNASGIKLPENKLYAVGMTFIPADSSASKLCRSIIEEVVSEKKLDFLGWREVPADVSRVGKTAQESAPQMMQFFVSGDFSDTLDFDRKLYVVRRMIENRVVKSVTSGADSFHVASLSCRTIVYKGMMMANQVAPFYADLNDALFKSALAVVHQRYSTNTFPTWGLAQPFRFIAHNGEINTLRGNVNNMKARYDSLHSDIFGEDIKELLPIVIEGGSDSACFDNVLELLALSGRSLAHSMMMMVPEAWGTKYFMGSDRRAFCEYHSTFMPPWDGPAAMVCTDGSSVVSVLDRNGLRPARYVVTKSGMIVLGSEVGVLEFPPEGIKEKGRLSPGVIIEVDTERGLLLKDEAVKATVCRSKPYRRWLSANRVVLRGLFEGTAGIQPDVEKLFERQQAFGYTREDLENIILPMVVDGKEPIGSMGDDTPLAVLSDKPVLLYNYFKQLFAQVTNPPIDPIREELVMSLTTYIGRQGDLLSESPEHVRMLKLATPILTNDDLSRIRNAGLDEFRNKTLDMTFSVSKGEAGLSEAIENLCLEAEKYSREGCTIIILSDRDIGPGRAAIPALLAVAAVNLHLTETGFRTQMSILLESGEPRQVMHYALLLGYGVSAINPYLAMETIADMRNRELISSDISIQDALEHYIKAVEKGLLKIFSKMGISTLRSYRGAQIFEALGLSEKFIDKYFTDTPTRIGGIDLEGVARESLARHENAFKARAAGPRVLDAGGNFALRKGGERHMWTPDAIRFLQQSTRNNDVEIFKKFCAEINGQQDGNMTLRSLFDFKEGKSIPLDQVEPASEIVKRFVTGAMSFGSISREAHEAIAVAMNRIGGKSNSGEGGEDRARFIKDENGDSRSSATKQVASGRFGVTNEYLVNAEEIQIKIAQGAKPGEGGQLPGYKVNIEIAQTRNSTPGVSLISPPPHHDIYSIEDLAQLIYDLKNVNPRARINVKLVSEVGVGTIAAGVSKGHADALLISGGDGGTGASPVSSIKGAGIPWELGLSETQQTLVKNNLRGRIRVQTDGQIRTGRDLAVAALLGAEEYGFATTPLIVMGCVMMRKCHKNTCPVGVATQDPELRKRFTGKAEYLINYFNFLAEDLREIMAELGFKKVDDMIGRADRLQMRSDIKHWKAASLDLESVFHVGKDDKIAVRHVEMQDHGIDKALDNILISDSRAALEEKNRVELSYDIKNVNRTFGTMLSGKIAEQYGIEGLPEDTITVKLNGSSGQSLGAFAARGLTLELHGDSNDYVGKGLSGGKIIVRPPAGSTFATSSNAIIGNVALYGATSGEAYFAGSAGERFAIRNSGAKAVVEGVGDHGCEYMTGGVIVVLGKTGVNFAGGMSGGIAYIFDKEQKFDLRCNLDMVDLEPVCEEDDIFLLKSMVETHLKYTGSNTADTILNNWEEFLPLFVKVMPMEYRRALGQVTKIEAKSRRTEEEVVQDG
ncbi:MAG: glutamate synthase large subunit [Planctomycetota bacterium]|jgi:glutamate synthase domain-containing protein 2/glutamate synthase domain-containing protein 1/glutamate synthase domain-containing protein 3